MDNISKAYIYTYIYIYICIYIILHNSAVISRHIMIKCLKSKEKEMTMKTVRKNLYLTYREEKIQTTVNFSSESNQEEPRKK